MPWQVEGKRVLVTGGTSGIGRATAEALAARGADVMITARDPGKGADVAGAIRAATGLSVAVGHLDLARLASVRGFADELLDGAGVDVLVNNAGTMAGRRRETVDGIEWTFAVNHLGPFVLTRLLTESPTPPARVITVSSEVHRNAKTGLRFDDLQMRAGYSSQKAYAASKLANILMTAELDRRAAGVTARALHPGVVATGFGKGDESPRSMGLMMTMLSPVLKSPAKGARTSVLLASADDDLLEHGLYWSGEAPRDPSPAALDGEAATRLWDASNRMAADVLDGAGQ